MVGERGEPGEPGERGEGSAGGAGGAGGRGGAGKQEGAGGRGGGGGEGGRGAPGERGERGPRGPVNHLAVIGYLILTAFVVGALYRTAEIANQQEAQLRTAEIERTAIARRFQEADARLATQDERQLAALRTILCLANRQTQTSRQRTPAEKAQSARFYVQALESINAKPCDKEE